MASNRSLFTHGKMRPHRVEDEQRGWKLRRGKMHVRKSVLGFDMGLCVL